ncbi:MAG: RagB/SusD family nutrient uptake outer membrane protein [Bacteroides sp.]
MRYLVYPIALLLFLGLASSCNKFLDKNPDSDLSINIDSEDRIAELLTGAYPEASYIPFLEPRTDNVAERPKGVQNSLNEAMYFWEDYAQEDIDTPLNYWNECYRGIAQANKALELLQKYEKTERVKALYGEAFLLRAYLHFMLVNIWAEPYGGSAANMGIPYITKPEKHALVDYSRGTVNEVYEKIEADLKRGISLVNDAYYKQPKFHFNKRAAYAFASRFYLFKGEWHTVIEYANFVLGVKPQPFLRPWVQYMRNLEFHHEDLHKIYSTPTEQANLLLTTTESRLARQQPIERYGATSTKLGTVHDAFNKRYHEHLGDVSTRFEEFYTFSNSSAPVTNGRYMAKFDELSTTESIGSKPRGLYVTNVLLTTDEVLLNRMEAYVMLQEYDKAIDDFVEYCEAKFGYAPTMERALYTSTSIANYDKVAPWYGLSLGQLAMVRLILDFRRKEFFQEGLRWFDLRRFHIAVKRTSKSPYYFPLEKDDLRKVLQIPVEAQRRGLPPNPRDRQQRVR